MTKSIACILLLLTVASASADSPDSHAVQVTPNHSTVNLIFVSKLRINQQPATGQVDQAIVGNLVTPMDQIDPISITINDDFVGHAMTGFQNIMPKFVLASGTYTFHFTCEGYEPVSKKIKVVGSGSNQYLFVRMVETQQATVKVKPQDSTSDAARRKIGSSDR